jgi:AcrR family transcriptional regulator
VTAVLEAPRKRVGRPQDPEVGRKVLCAGRRVLAAGLAGFTADAIVSEAGVGKASLYRRWRTLDELLVDVVRHLGVRPVDHGHGPGSLNADLARVLHAATTGRDARAELAVLSSLPRSPELRTAYTLGPGTRLLAALDVVNARSRHRGEPSWPSMSGPIAGFRLLQHRTLISGDEPSLAAAGDVVDRIVLPALGYRP